MYISQNDLPVKGMYKYTHLMFTIASIFYMAGFLTDYLILVATHQYAMLWDNVFGFVTVAIIFALYWTDKIKLNTAFILQNISVSLKLHFYFVHKIIDPASEPDIYLYAATCVLIIPIVLAGLTTWRYLSFVIASATILLFIVAAFVSHSPGLMAGIPTVTFVLTGASSAFYMVVKMVKDYEQQTAEEIEKQLVMTRFFNLAPGDWKLIQEGKISREYAQKIIEKSDKIVETSLINKVKQIVHSEEAIKIAIRKHHPHLTARDLELCCYIVDNMSVTDISRVRHVEVSSITAHRSRLRTKLGLSPKEDLRDYLDSLVSE